jgi:hypothetical protein
VPSILLLFDFFDFDFNRQKIPVPEQNSPAGPAAGTFFRLVSDPKTGSNPHRTHKKGDFSCRGVKNYRLARDLQYIFTVGVETVTKEGAVGYA